MVQIFSIVWCDKKIGYSLYGHRVDKANVEAYAKGHYHLVNQQTANMVKDNEPDIPEPGDQEWLASHPAIAGSGKAPRMQIYAGQKKRRL